MGTLMTSISGIRGIVGSGLEPETILKYTNAYADFIGKGSVMIGRDARITGKMVNQITSGILLAKGIDVIDIGICPTPTVQFNVKKLRAQGGIAISASHIPNEWNAFTPLNVRKSAKPSILDAIGAATRTVLPARLYRCATKS